MKASGGKNLDEIAARIRAFRLIVEPNQEKAAAKFDIAYSTYKRYENGTSAPGSKAIAGMARVGLNTNWLVTGEGEMLIDADTHPYCISEPVTHISNDDSVAIDKYVDVNGSAGPGATVGEEAIVKVRVDIRLLRERIGNGFEKIKIASVSGDSMEPTLSHGDQVLVNTACDRFIDDAIYAIQQDGHLRFKRIQLKLDGSIVVRSDASSNIETYSAEEAAAFYIVGMVIPFKFGRFKV